MRNYVKRIVVASLVWRRRLATTGVIGLTLVLSGCGLVDPCETGIATGIAGKWELIAVDGKPIPPSGASIPLTSERLTGGRLNLKRTFALSDCGGDDEDSNDKDPSGGEEGTVVLLYSRVNSTGQPVSSEPHMGKYGFDFFSEKVTLTSGGNKVIGRRVIDELFFESGYVPLLGQNHTLRFRRVR